MFAWKFSKFIRKTGSILTIFVLSSGLFTGLGATEFLELPAGYVQPKQCSFNLIGTSDIETGLPVRLTSGWSQEGVGLPEVREFLEEKKLSLRWVRTGVLDDSYDIANFVEVIDQPESVRISLQSLPDSEDTEGPTHGNHVAAVIAGRHFGLSHNAYFSALFSGLSGLEQTYLADDGKPIEIVNRSLSVSSDTNSVLQGLVQKNGGRPFLLVNSAGNEYLHNMMERGSYTSYFDGTPALIVSAVTPTGRIHTNSGGGSQVVIGAPSYGPGLMHPKDYHQVLDGGLSFSGTSAAAPMVTGALVSVLGLLEGLTYEEAKELLIQTSFLTKSFQTGHNFGGYGVLNFYKMMRVAHRLYEKGWPQSRDLIFQSGPNSIYDFSIEAAHNFEIAGDVVKIFNEGTCDSKLSVLKLLRKSFFLDPSRAETRQSLFALYANEAYHDQAIYYSPVALEYYGSGLYTKHNLERSLLNFMSTGDYEGALTAMRRGKSFIADIFSAPVLHAIGGYIVDYSHPKRSELIRTVRNALGAKGRGIFTELLRVGANRTLKKDLLIDLIQADIAFPQEFADDLLYECVVRKCDVPTLILLLEQGADIHHKTFSGANLLTFAAYGGDVNIVRFLLNKGVEVNHFDRRGHSPLAYAVTKEHIEIVRLLLQRGAQITEEVLNLAQKTKNQTLINLLN